MTSRIPPLLQPYLSPPLPGSLVVLSGALAATANWLLLLFLAAGLAGSAAARKPPEAVADHDIAVLLVSWLHDWEFWRLEARRSAGLDLARLRTQGRFVFVDGLTSLHAPSKPAAAHATPALNSTALAPTTSAVLAALTTLKAAAPAARILLLLDHPHVLLATAAAPDPAALQAALLAWRAHVHAAVVVCPADGPLVRAAAAPAASTPLERATAALTVGLAHQARFVLGVRPLETGWAADVSGVLRAGIGGGAEEEGVEEGEWLYHVKGDGGSVRVWKRGDAAG